MNKLFDNIDNFVFIKDVKSIPVVSKGDDSCTFTIGIPTYKRSLDLLKALNSAINQNFNDKYNILIVDNNPERGDETETLICNEFANCPRLSYYKNEQNIGMAGNWNRLFELCLTSYMIMLHDDDYLLPDYLTAIKELVSSEEDVTVANVSKIIWNGEFPMPRYNPCDRIKVFRYSKFSNYPYFHFGPPSGCLFRKDTVINEGGFDKDWYPSMDYAFIVKLCFHGRKVLRIKNKLLLYKSIENTTSKPETQELWIKIDSEIKSQMAEELHLPHAVQKVVVFFEMGIRKYYIKQIVSGKKVLSFSDEIFVLCFRAYRFLYRIFFETLNVYRLK